MLTRATYRNSGPTVESGIRRAIGRTFGAFLLSGLIIGTVFPNFIFKDISGFLLLALALLACGVTPGIRDAVHLQRSFVLISLCFLGVGTVAVVLSALGLFELDAELPLRRDYILRHAYFLFFWLPFVWGAAGFWNSSLSFFNWFCNKFGLPLLISMAAGDFATSIWWGDKNTIEWVGYAFYFEKFTFQFLFSLVFLIYVSNSRNSTLGICVIGAYAALCLVLKLGIMFNAFTGEIAFLILFICALPIIDIRIKALLLVGLLFSLWAFVIVGLFRPDLFASDENNYWRLLVWRNNLDSLWNNYLLGVGFGVPYHPLTTENLINTLRNSFDSVSVILNDPIEPQYVRGQHSSFINMFYRLGLAGGLFFFTLVLIPIIAAFKRTAQGPRRSWDPLIAALGLYILQVVQMTVHVGIESPRFLILYLLSVEYVVYACSKDKLARG